MATRDCVSRPCAAAQTIKVEHKEFTTVEIGYVLFVFEQTTVSDFDSGRGSFSQRVSAGPGTSLATRRPNLRQPKVQKKRARNLAAMVPRGSPHR